MAAVDPVGGLARRSTLGVMTERNFWPYLAGNLLSNCGTWFQNLGQIILIYNLTHSTLLVGVVNFAQFVGVFLLAPWAGGAADHFDRRRLLVVTQLGAVAVTATLAGLAATHHDPPWVVILLALLLGLTTAFAIPTLQALVPQLVSKADLPPAVALSSATFNLARAIGPALGALVVSRLGVPAAFGLNSLSYLALIAGLLVVKIEARPRPSGGRPKLSESLRLVRTSNAGLGVPLLVVMAVSLSADPVNTLTPAFAHTILHRPESLVGILVGAFGVGSVAAAFGLAGRGGDPSRWTAAGCFTLAVGMIGFAATSSLPIALLLLLIGGFGFLSATTSCTTLLQLRVTEEQRGRVMALWSVAFLGVRPFGSLVDGAVASGAGVRAGATLMAVPALVAGVGLLSGKRRAGRG